MYMKKIADVDVTSLYDEIEMSCWENLPDVGYGPKAAWGGTQLQEMINHKKWFGDAFNNYTGTISKELKDILLPDFCPTEFYFYYPNMQKFLFWFNEIYGGKFARVVYYKTPAGKSVNTHIDAQADKYVKNTPQKISPERKEALYFNKDRFHLVISGEYTYTVETHDEDIIYDMSNLRLYEFDNPLIECFRGGEMWWFNNKRPHTSYNHSDTSKINLVFDVEGSHWRNML